VGFVYIAQYFNGRKVYVPFWTETWKRDVLCQLLTNRICDREINYKVYRASSFSVCLLPLCGIALFISVFQGTFMQNFDNCTLKWLCCVINLYNLLLAVTPSETCYDITDLSVQLKMREIRNEGVFLCNCKIIKFDLKISISSINPSHFHIKQMCIINIPIFWELI